MNTVLNDFPKILQSVILQAKRLGKTIYVFSVDSDEGKVAHVNYVAEDARLRGLDARTWANAVVEVVGGKVRILIMLTSATIFIDHDRLVERRTALRVSVLILPRLTKDCKSRVPSTPKRRGFDPHLI